MTFDELKERLATEAKQTWEKVQESATFNQLRDRYDNLSPFNQKLTVVGLSAFVSLIILSVPYSSYTVSQESVTQFEEKRTVIRELLKVSREASEIPNIPEPPPLESLKSMADNQIKNANLTAEQIKSVAITNLDSKLVPANLTSGSLEVSLAKLNLRQVVDLGYQLQAINPSVKLQDLLITANLDNHHYFDATYRLIALAVPSAPVPEPEAPPRGRRK